MIKFLGCWIWLRLQINSEFNHMPYPLVPELTKQSWLQPLHCAVALYYIRCFHNFSFTKTLKTLMDFTTINILFIIQKLLFSLVWNDLALIFSYKDTTTGAGGFKGKHPIFFL